MSVLDYQRWVAEALLSIVPRALHRVVEDGLPDGHALYISFDTRHPEVQLHHSLTESHPELMTIVIEHQFWDLSVDDDGFSVVLAFGGRRRPVFVPWASVRGFADPPAEFAFDTTGRVSAGVRRLVSGEAVSSDSGVPGDDGEPQPDDTDRFVHSRSGSRPASDAASPAGEIVPFSRPTRGKAANYLEIEGEEE